jgi:hypothetical protein
MNADGCRRAARQQQLPHAVGASATGSMQAAALTVVVDDQLLHPPNSHAVCEVICRSYSAHEIL